MCTVCAHRVFINPKPGAAALIIKGSSVLLVRRAEQPYQGHWVLPSGYVEYDETPLECALRETREEAGLDVALDQRPFGVYTNRDDPRADMTLIVYLGTTRGGEPLAGDDALEVRWFDVDNLPADLAFDGIRQALADWKDQYGRDRNHLPPDAPYRG